MPAEIAVLMAAYNADSTLRLAVESVLAGTANCRLFLVDDCSRVPVEQLLGPMDRLEVIRLDRNMGLANALNRGLEHILARNYQYIARMDADDVSYPERLAKQLAFLEANPQIGVVGSAARFMDDKTGATIMFYRPPLDHDGIRKRLFFNNCFVHPTWLMRTEVVRRFGPYSLRYTCAEDYEFMRRIVPHVRLANLPDYLLDYRITGTGISVSKRRRQLLDRLRIQLSFFQPAEWRSYAGALVTIGLFVVPMKWITAVKVEWRGAPPPIPSLAGNGPDRPRG